MGNCILPSLPRIPRFTHAKGVFPGGETGGRNVPYIISAKMTPQTDSARGEKIKKSQRMAQRGTGRPFIR
jgi:hypothetical protein